MNYIYIVKDSNGDIVAPCSSLERAKEIILELNNGLPDSYYVCHQVSFGSNPTWEMIDYKIELWDIDTWK